MKTTIFILNCLGLLADIFGAAKLFYTRTQQIPKIEQSPAQFPYAHSSEFQQLINQINKVNSANDEIHKGSNKWLWCLVVGFGMQLLAGVLGFWCKAS